MDSTSALDLSEVRERCWLWAAVTRPGVWGHGVRRAGANVSVVEMLSGLLPGADRDLVIPLQQAPRKKFQLDSPEYDGCRDERGNPMAAE